MSAVLACAVLGCGGDRDKDKPTDSAAPCPDTTTPALAIDAIHIACDAQDHVRLQVETTGIPDDVRAFVQATSRSDAEADQVAENHTLVSVAPDPCGLSDTPERQLLTASDEASETSTTFTCEELTSNALTIAFAILDDSSAVVSCVVVGHDPTGLANAVYRRTIEPSFDTSGCVEGTAIP